MGNRNGPQGILLLGVVLLAIGGFAFVLSRYWLLIFEIGGLLVVVAALGWLYTILGRTSPKDVERQWRRLRLRLFG